MFLRERLVFPLLFPKCGGQIRLIAFITEGVQIRRILDHIGVDSEPPRISPARAPPLWDHGEPAMRAGNPGLPRNSKPVPGCDTAACVLERPYPFKVTVVKSTKIGSN
jgi:hypothetical protein